MRPFRLSAIAGVLFSIVVAARILVHAQAAPLPADAFFDDSQVHSIYLTINSKDWQSLQEHVLENTYYPSDFKWNTEVVRNIGIRSRGTGSRYGAKPGLRVDFDRYVSDQKFLTLKSFVLRNNTQDNTNMHERISMLMFKRLGEPAPRLFAVNIDEGEPGTFKDRYFLERDPHRFLEGMLIGAHVVEATEIYIYLRDEYPASREILEREIAKLPPGGPVLHMRRGAGAYICGEESSLLESIEGKRGLPRHKPPYPFQVGLFGLPTLINNIETLWWVRDIVEKGADWWKSHGRNDRHGLRSYSVSGRVKNPGMKLAPAGVTVRELIDEFCGGMAAGHTFHAYLPGGASGGILPASMDNIPLDFGTLEKYGCFIGSAAIIILSEQDSVKDAALNLMRFFEDESCGQCTPCRVGTQKAALLMEKPVWNRDLLDELSQVMRDASICGLGQAASNPLTSVIKYFPEEFVP
jgi:NADH:ubiquinone oxidoreductase subunit F (NADH-binding)